MEAQPSPLSSRPERTRISCHAAVDMAACAPFCKGKAHEMHQRHQLPQEIRGSAVEGPAIPPTVFTNLKANSCSPQPHAPAPAPVNKPPAIDGTPIAPTG